MKKENVTDNDLEELSKTNNIVLISQSILNDIHQYENKKRSKKQKNQIKRHKNKKNKRIRHADHRYKLVNINISNNIVYLLLLLIPIESHITMTPIAPNGTPYALLFEPSRGTEWKAIAQGTPVAILNNEITLGEKKRRQTMITPEFVTAIFTLTDSTRSMMNALLEGSLNSKGFFDALHEYCTSMMDPCYDVKNPNNAKLRSQ